MERSFNSITAFADAHPLATQAITSAAQALFAFVLVVIGAIQTAIYFRIRRDGIARDGAFLFMKNVFNIEIYDQNRTGIVYWYFSPIVENGGNTPALSVFTRANLYPNKDGVPSDYEYPDFITEDNPIPAPTFVGPKGQVGIGGFEVSVTDLIAIKSGTQRMFMYGWAEYNDVFNRFHRTEYCFELIVEGDPTKRGAASTTFTQANLMVQTITATASVTNWRRIFWRIDRLGRRTLPQVMRLAQCRRGHAWSNGYQSVY
jgi:hypothetical protein